MTGQADLERGYRRVLACYPRSFRHESEQEILVVLMASAREGQHRVGLAESADLVRGALRMRLRPGPSRPPRTVFAAVRLIFTAFFGLITFSLLSALASHAAVYAPADLVADAAEWLVALAAVVLSFSGKSWPFYVQQPARR